MPNPNAKPTDDADDDTTTLEGSAGDAASDGGDEQDGSGDTAEGDKSDGSTPDESAAGAASEPADVVVSIGDETPVDDDEGKGAPSWVKDLRKSNREKDRRIRELEQKLTAPVVANDVPALGEKPTLKGCDYDEEAYEAKLADWHAAKRKIDDAKTAQEAAQKKAQDDWNARLKTYKDNAKTLKVPDFEDAEGVVQDRLSVVQQGVILKGAEKPELVVYALAKNPKKLAELSAISDPIAFAFAVAKVETMLKEQPRRAAPTPERVISGSAPGAGVAAANLEKLREQAQKTGDFTKYLAAKRAAQQKAA